MMVTLGFLLTTFTQILYQLTKAVETQLDRSIINYKNTSKKHLQEQEGLLEYGIMLH